MRRSGFSFGEQNVFVRVLIGCAIMLVTVCVLSLPAALVIGMTEDPLSLIDIGSLVTLLLGAALSSFIISKLSGDKKMLVAALSSLLFCLILIVFGLILSGGEIGVRVFLNYVCYFGVSLLFSRIGALEGKRRHKTR